MKNIKEMLILMFLVLNLFTLFSFATRPKVGQIIKLDSTTGCTTLGNDCLGEVVNVPD